MFGEEDRDLTHCRDEPTRELRVRRVADDHQESGVVSDDGGQFIWFVADSGVVRDCYPAALGYRLEPLLVRTVRREMIRMALYTKTCVTQNRRELVG